MSKARLRAMAKEPRTSWHTAWGVGVGLATKAGLERDQSDSVQG